MITYLMLLWFTIFSNPLSTVTAISPMMDKTNTNICRGLAKLTHIPSFGLRWTIILACWASKKV
ncbi:hypothetical protein Hanom_Chr05g00425391 [Helianthus anomalus]